jgi:hypothetical protein
VSSRRDWFAVQCRLVRLPKFRRLSDDAQLTLFYVWAIAGDETPEATWRTTEDLLLALQVHGRNPAMLVGARAQGAGAIEELRAGGWLDSLEDGRLAIHDWDDHQVYASREIKNAWEAARLRKWRKARQAPPPASSSSSSSSSSSTEETVQVRTTNVQEATDPRTLTSEEYDAILKANWEVKFGGIV